MTVHDVCPRCGRYTAQTGRLCPVCRREMQADEAATDKANRGPWRLNRREVAAILLVAVLAVLFFAWLFHAAANVSR